MTSRYQILDKHTVVDIICSKLTSHRMAHLTLRLRCDTALRNPLYIMVFKCISGGNWSTEKNTVNCMLYQVYPAKCRKQTDNFTDDGH